MSCTRKANPHLLIESYPMQNVLDSQASREARVARLQMPRGAKGVNPNSILVTNSHETIPKMTFTRRRFLM